MKKILSVIMGAALVCACTAPIALNQGDEVILDKWTLSQEGNSKTYDVEVPSTVAGVLCDPGFYRQ